jgi:5-methylcytosine-specific restriction endonuclease McrA
VTVQANRRGRLGLILELDGPTCVWCGRRFEGLVRPTTEHLVPRLKGGPSWLENEVLACRRCNAERGHRGPAEWLAECERRGWQPDVEAVTRVLRSLDRAITERGGQRRARPYLAAQLRRLRDQAA